MFGMLNLMLKVRDETNLASSSLVDTGNANDLLGVIVSYSIKVFHRQLQLISSQILNVGEADAGRDGR